MDDYLLTFETDGEGDQIFVHGDPEGLEYFANALLKLAKHARAGEFPHDHFFTEEWAGYELSSVPQETKGKLINHVKVYGCLPKKALSHMQKHNKQRQHRPCKKRMGWTR